MPKLGKKDASDTVDLEGYEGHFGEVGDYTVAFETYTADSDMSALFKGLPDDKCQCPHWGVVLKGKLTYTTADGEFTASAGEAYYAPLGISPICTRGPRSSSSAPPSSSKTHSRSSRRTWRRPDRATTPRSEHDPGKPPGSASRGLGHTVSAGESNGRRASAPGARP